MTSELAAQSHKATSRGAGFKRRPSEIMSALGIVQLGNPTLTRATIPFTFPNDRIEMERIRDRLTTIADAVSQVHEFTTGAMGLAAPQINEPRSMAIFRPANEPQLVLINPQVIEMIPADRENWEEASEGCLSFFDFRCILKRPRSVSIKYHTMTGESVAVIFDQGRLARDVLHEVDHLEGVLCLDHIASGTPSVWIA